MAGKFHVPVLQQEVVDLLVTTPKGVYLDCTVGGGGHAEGILRKLDSSGVLVGLDADEDALRFAAQRLSTFPNVRLRRAFFDQLDIVLVQEELLPVQGILFDLGISSFQVDEKEKGFSFMAEGPLDMRFNRKQELTARQVVNSYSEAELGRILREYGEERMWRKIARRIVEARQEAPIETTTQLAAVVRSVVKTPLVNKTLARVFQAIRIEVNDELNRLRRALEKAFECLDEGGRLAVIAYHSLEDRIVKEFIRYKELDCVCPPEFPRCVCDKVREMSAVTRKPIFPTPEEIARNPRARSARLRVAEKVVPYKEIV